MATPAQQIEHLNKARRIVLNDAAHYPDIISGILPLVSTNHFLETQRWGADFMAEAFASPMVSGTLKEKMSVTVLPAVQDWLDNQQDEPVVKSAIQTAASIYQYIFRYVTNNPSATAAWDSMASIKSSILRRFDTAPVGIRIVCIKFVQRVVQVQTHGIIADPRRPEQNEISAALVPRDHPVIPLSKLEAEASGLMDRLLRVFQETHSDAIIVDATLNCLSVLVRTRQSVSNKIISAVLSFNPLKGIKIPLSARDKFHVRSMERTTRAFLLNIARRNEHSQFISRIKQYVERNMQARLEVEGAAVSKKRGLSEPTDGLDDAKRQRLGASAEPKPSFPPMPPPPLSLAQVFSLTNEATSSFDASTIPAHLVVRIIIALVQNVSSDRLTESLNAVRSRLLELDRIAATPAPTQPVPAPVPVADGGEDDDYEPEFEPVETFEQATNRLDAAPEELPREIEVPEVALGPFKLPQPAPISQQEAQTFAQAAVGRVFSMIERVDAPAKLPKAGLNRLAGTHFDNDAWVTLITRLATRAPSNFNMITGELSENDTDAKSEQLLGNNVIADDIRETLFKWVVADFRHRINVAISWLNEEWYCEELSKRSNSSSSQPDPHTYDKWTLRFLDSILPYLDAKDKIIVRFLSEIPALSEGVFKRVKSIANDPDRAGLAVNALHYLIMTRPPVRDKALDALEDLYKNYQGAAVTAKKVLAKWRPAAIDGSGSNGNSAGAAAVKQEAPSRTANSATPVNGSSVPPTGDPAGPILIAKDSNSNTEGNLPMVAAGS